MEIPVSDIFSAEERDVNPGMEGVLLVCAIMRNMVEGFTAYKITKNILIR